MPPRAAPAGNRGGPPPSGDRGGHRGGGRGRGRSRGGAAAAARGGSVGLPGIAASVTTIGVKRPDYGTAGVVFNASVNAFPTTIPESTIYHYDVAITPDNLPRTRNQEIIKILQHETAPTVFSRCVPYDGNKNIYSPYKLPLGEQDTGQFYVNTGARGRDGQPKLTSVKITLAQRINPDVLARFVNGEMSQDVEVQTALMAMNVAIRMEVIQRYPYNIRSFFTPEGKRAIGGGFELWRGFFQSVRPTIGRVLINVDISTAMMFKPGPLIDLCLDFFGRPGLKPNDLSATGMPDRERLRLQRFLGGVCVVVETEKRPDGRTRKRAIKSLSRLGADRITFDHDGRTISVAQYFQMKFGRPLRFPNVLCVELGNSKAYYPLEVCTVPSGQIARKQVPPEKTKDMVEFATKKPHERLSDIRSGVNILQYGQSDYIREFGMNISTAEGPLSVQMRKLNTPTLKYGPGSRQPTVVPNNGSWNMVDKKFYVPCEPIHRWAIVIYERQQRFNPESLKGMIRDFIIGCKAVGITVTDDDPIYKYENPQGNISQQLKNAGMACVQKARIQGPPQLILVVLPDSGNAIYDQVKHFGDITMGVATQCVKSNKAFRAKPQYWANVILKVNVKLGGINVIPDPSAVSAISDPSNPTIVLGADVIHPAPGSEGRPSFAAVVGSIDSHCAKYVATNRVQAGRQEIIDDLQAMVVHVLNMFKQYRQAKENSTRPPTRLIFYRDGVSEGQFSHVLERELPLIKAACAEVGVSPKITLIVVGKRHHIRFFPRDPQTADRSGNCPAGSVADQGIAHPTEFDFYLQSHGGLLGTSRPAHYSVLYDENNFNSNSLQLLSFGLCHVYARSTRSVSIPAPVYYADIVCSRAKHHYDPSGDLGLSETATQVSGRGDTTLEAFKAAFKPLHAVQQRLMYFS